MDNGMDGSISGSGGYGGGFGGYGMGNPGSYGGQQSVGAPGHKDGYHGTNPSGHEEHNQGNAGRRIVTQGFFGAGRGAVTGAIVGTPVLGVGALPSAIAGGMIGLSLGLLQGAVCEAFECSEKLNDIQEKYDDHCEWSENL
jgi:hypothetical protein